MQFSTEKLLDFLQYCTNGINNGTIDLDTQEHLWYSLNWDKNDPDNQEMIKYLFTGWWVHNQLKLQNNEG